MTPTIFVKPSSPGLLVRKGTGRGNYLAQEGEHVPDDAFWRAYVRSGDVTIIEPAKTAKKAKED